MLTKQMGLPLGGALGALAMPPIALALGWRASVLLSAGAIAALALATWALYRDPPAEPDAPPPAAASESFRRVLGNRDLWLVALSLLALSMAPAMLLLAPVRERRGALL